MSTLKLHWLLQQADFCTSISNPRILFISLLMSLIMINSNYYRGIIIGFLSSSALFLLAAFLQTGVPTKDSRWLYNAYAAKAELANQMPSPKILVVSGSNALLGISCETIQKEMNVPCLNAAINVGLGLEYTFHYAQSFAKPGDTILLPLEYELYYSSDAVNNVLVDYVFSRDPKYLDSLDLSERVDFFKGLGIERLLVGLLSKLDEDANRRASRGSALNQNGDRTSNLASEMTAEHYKRLQAARPFKVPPGFIQDSSNFNSYGFDQIKAFAEWCQRNNIRLIATWPNLMYFEEYQEQEYQIFFQKIRNFYASIEVPVVGKPYDSMYEQSLFYDTAYHLNDEGVRKRTHQLLKLLLPYLTAKLPNENSNFTNSSEF